MITPNCDIATIVPSLLIPKKWSLVEDTTKPESKLSLVSTNYKRILVIDDEVNIADSLTEILNSQGYEARAVYSGQAAIDSVKAQCPDLVLSDVIMPRLNGVDTVLAIREICPATRILLFSGQAGTADVLEKARAEGHEFELLPKPIHPDRLLKKLSDLRKS